VVGRGGGPAAPLNAPRRAVAHGGRGPGRPPRRCRTPVFRRLDTPGRCWPHRIAERLWRFQASSAGGAAFRRGWRSDWRDRALSRTRSASVSVAIVDYGSGNLHSAAKTFERAAHESGLGQPIAVTRDPEVVARADRVVLPGVGAFADCRRGLDAVPGMVEALEQAVRGKGRPFFGICVGMQLLAERGREYEVVEGL